MGIVLMASQFFVSSYFIFSEKIRLQTKNQLPWLHGSALKVPTRYQVKLQLMLRLCWAVTVSNIIKIWGRFDFSWVCGWCKGYFLHWEGFGFSGLSHNSVGSLLPERSGHMTRDSYWPEPWDCLPEAICRSTVQMRLIIRVKPADYI